MFLLIINLLSIAFTPADTLNLISSFGSFQEAVSVSASREEFIYVCDAQTNQIYKFSSSGALLANSGGSGFGNSQLNMPRSIDATNGLDVYICDYQNNRLQRYDLNLNYIATFDFNFYNTTADNSRKIYRPFGVAYLTTSDIFVLADATSYRVVKLKAFDDVGLLFGSKGFGFDALNDPSKIIKGGSLDIWILDKGSDEFINFDNYGTLVRRVENPYNNEKLVSLAYYKNKLYLLNKMKIIEYDIKAGKYVNMYAYSIGNNSDVTDITVFNENKLLLLTKQSVYLFQITNL